MIFGLHIAEYEYIMAESDNNKNDQVYKIISEALFPV